MCAEGSYLFITIGNVDQVVCMLEVDLGVDLGTAWSI